MSSNEKLPTILIVDDNIFNIITLETMIELQFQIKVDKATNGLEAVNKVKERRQLMNVCGNTQPFYSLIFMDCNMPIMDGFEATEEIRKLDFID